MIAAGLALGSMGEAIAALYNITTEINSWVDKHIQEMQASKNVTISRTGKVLEGAKFGFGIGFTTPIMVMSVGQYLLGNPLDAAAVIVTAPTNPIAMTCAAVGAIYFGWKALSDEERSDALDKLSKGLEIGPELIKSVIRFIIDSINQLIDSGHRNLLKISIQEMAGFFGRSLYDVTRSIRDKINFMIDGIPSQFKRLAVLLDANGDGAVNFDDFRVLINIKKQKTGFD